MIDCKSYLELENLVLKTHFKNKSQRTIILMGGCSRVGKTTLARKLQQAFTSKNINSQIISLDAWLVSVEKRKHSSKVIDRYETDRMISEIKKLVQGERVEIPKYDPVSRIRINENNSTQVDLKSGLIIIEGVIALAIGELIKISNIKIHIDTKNCNRLKRLIHFYKKKKALPPKKYKNLILDRENEEIPFVRKAAGNADIILNW